MKKGIWCACTGVWWSVIFVSGTHATSATILLVDFNDDTSPSLTQSGFSAFVETGSSGTRSFETPIGTLDVTISGHDVVSGGGFFVRSGPTNNGAFTLSSLYRDFAFHNNGGVITVDIVGVHPNLPYELTFWSSDRFDGAGYSDVITNTIAAGGNTFGTGGAISFDRNLNATSDDQHSFTSTFQSPTGTLTFNIRATEGSLTRLNGFALAIPEPSSALLAGLGAFGLFLRRRR